MGNPKEEYQQRQREALEKHVEEINASIIPDRPGYVRTEGPRRQHRAEIRNGELYLTEI
tara:strand:+ start:444 stop:620 length:177 start_codon:yes stop_codon:yes gene_type:complete